MVPFETLSSASFAELVTWDVSKSDVIGVGVEDGVSVTVGVGVSDGVIVGPPGVIDGSGVSVGMLESIISKESVNVPTAGTNWSDI